jgi:VanZ family protein
VSTSRLASAWLPVVLWAGLIFGLSAIPSLGTGLGTWDLVLRKCAHVTEYAIFGFLLLRAIGSELPSFVLGVAYAASDEAHQTFVRGRHGALYDVAIDAFGVLLGILALRRALRT